MDYDRIHKPQTGMISPSKLRMKLMGHQKKKEGSNTNSSRTSPSKLEDAEFVRNSLLASDLEDFYQEVSGIQIESVKPVGTAVLNYSQGDYNSYQQREHGSGGRVKLQQFSKGDGLSLSSVHPMRALEDDIDYDSNASSSSFEFQGERSVNNPIGRSHLRPKSSKWNDAEKWIMNRQVNHLKNSNLQSQAVRMQVKNGLRFASESASNDNKSAVKRVDFCQPAEQMSLEKFSFLSPVAQPTGQGNGTNLPIDLCPHSKDLEAVESKESSCMTVSGDGSTGPVIRAVSMRDMGTEMTPIPSQEPSRTATPVRATTPIRSPTSSLPSTPRGVPTCTRTDYFSDVELKTSTKGRTKELSEQELKLKTRKEIVALGVQLGKTNIAAWASKDEKDNNAAAAENSELEELRRIEFEKRAALWEEAERSKHNARFKREEIKIQAWESQQKAKLDAEMRRIESQVEQMKAHAHAKMVKKIAMARQRSEEKRISAEAKKNSQNEKLAAKADYIRQTGRVPSYPYMCCG
ncbi:Carboxy-terminal region remorin [Heracleum sosnowskyi]|uniref:Carboxy-terminal region remorin n=1 Tax=Heracleum sosnowskyi TaxID=360622 RepID=A0AAD8I5V2_9APIA|nr:Carboxy-terminal region remorin [Heracleum sosnowskyi]